MTNSLDRKPNSAIHQGHRRKGDDPAWLWWLVAGSSIAAHLLLLGLALPFSNRLSATSSSPNPIPIDLIELTPANPPTRAAATTPTAASPAPTPAASQSLSTPAPVSAPTAPNSLPPFPTFPAATGDIAFSPSLPPLSPVPSPPAPSEDVPSPTAAPLPQLEPAPLPSSLPPIDSPNSPVPTVSPGLTNSPLPENPTAAASPFPSSLTPESEASPDPGAAPAPLATPTPPQIVTLPIGVPVPDVSETLPLPPSPIAQSLEQVETPEQAAPVTLTASLTAVDPATIDPAPDAAELPDTIARPLQNSETFAADPRSSPCLITPEVIPYLGETVAVQVTTNEAGEATDASVRQPSRSPVYDDLAVCMVKQWQFEPATAQGTPVASNALVVAIRIQP